MIKPKLIYKQYEKHNTLPSLMAATFVIEENGKSVGAVSIKIKEDNTPVVNTLGNTFSSSATYYIYYSLIDKVKYLKDQFDELGAQHE